MESEAESTKLVSAGVINDVAAEDHEPGHVPPLLRSGHHIVLTRREKSGLAAGHVLMDVRRDGYWCLIGEGWCTREAAAVGGQ